MTVHLTNSGHVRTYYIPVGATLQDVINVFCHRVY